MLWKILIDKNMKKRIISVTWIITCYNIKNEKRRICKYGSPIL